MIASTISKQERTKYIKNIEKHLKAYQSYLVAIKNLESQLTMVSPTSTSNYFKDIPSKHILHSDLNLMKTLTNTIEQALQGLSDIERRFVECRYFKKWSVDKCALEIGYSDKAIFPIRNQIMDKLLIRFGGIIYIN
ncbi:transcriptional regulator [Niallia sp. HCP3S3_B10]|uniref:transcriptional regulator n=1 Tax=Niallia sp. HCP3S3_B10 TaxID=3438944 RepID=UPI003F8BD337